MRKLYKLMKNFISWLYTKFIFKIYQSATHNACISLYVKDNCIGSKNPEVTKVLGKIRNKVCIEKIELFFFPLCYIGISKLI